MAAIVVVVAAVGGVVGAPAAAPVAAIPVPPVGADPTRSAVVRDATARAVGAPSSTATVVRTSVPRCTPAPARAMEVAGRSARSLREGSVLRAVIRAAEPGSAAGRALSSRRWRLAVDDADAVPADDPSATPTPVVRVGPPLDEGWPRSTREGGPASLPAAGAESRPGVSAWATPDPLDRDAATPNATAPVPSQTATSPRRCAAR
ncbi:hypothetical protein ACN27E_03675 [Mycobacterium sp. WMMD1722]|uniref:hypothetical protein n=1 Tax=Mycobacterium sp. WMMD1722 TaxID=3404117 RepID=UPI003BF4CAFD